MIFAFWMTLKIIREVIQLPRNASSASAVACTARNRHSVPGGGSHVLRLQHLYSKWILSRKHKVKGHTASSTIMLRTILYENHWSYDFAPCTVQCSSTDLATSIGCVRGIALSASETPLWRPALATSLHSLVSCSNFVCLPAHVTEFRDSYKAMYRPALVLSDPYHKGRNGIESRRCVLCFRFEEDTATVVRR